MLWFLKLCFVLILVGLCVFYVFQEKLIFLSKPLHKDHVYRFEGEFKEFFLKSADGAILNGLHFKAKEPKGIILYCHGNAGALDNWGAWGEILSTRYSYDVVIWDYRGYGKSTGKREQQRMLDDGHLFYQYCNDHFPEDRITLFGRSMGGFFATHMAKTTNPKRIILESTPTTLLEIAQKSYPFLPSKWLLKFRFENEGNIGLITLPTYLIHGTHDNLIPFEHGQRLFSVSAAREKRFFQINGGGHNDLASFKEPYYGALDVILN